MLSCNRAYSSHTFELMKIVICMRIRIILLFYIFMFSIIIIQNNDNAIQKLFSNAISVNMLRIHRSSYLKYGDPDPARPRAPKSGGSADPVVTRPLDEFLMIGCSSWCQPSRSDQERNAGFWQPFQRKLNSASVIRIEARLAEADIKLKQNWKHWVWSGTLAVWHSGWSACTLQDNNYSDFRVQTCMLELNFKYTLLTSDICQSVCCFGTVSTWFVVKPESAMYFWLFFWGSMKLWCFFLIFYKHIYGLHTV